MERKKNIKKEGKKERGRERTKNIEFDATVWV